MKAIIYLCMAFLPSMIECSPKKLRLQELFGKSRQEKKLLNDIFEPAEDGLYGYLGGGELCDVFKGKLHYSDDNTIEVAMKFTHTDHSKIAKKEYKMYTYLNAIDNPNVELYGIPSVYYYGYWNTYVMIGVTLLDSGFTETYYSKTSRIHEFDILIVCREIMRTLKYIHSCGVHHGDIRLQNVMSRGNNFFIIDLNQAEKMYNITELVELELDTSSREIGIERIKFDWRVFVQSVSDYYGASFDFDFDKFDETQEEIDEVIYSLKNDLEYFQIGNVLVKMANYIFGSNVYDKTSAYDQIYEMCQTEIDEFRRPTPALVHWLSDENKKKANDEYLPKPVISSIPDPTKLIRIKYPKVNYFKFDEKILRLRSGVSSSGKAKKTLTTSGSLDYGDELKKRRSK